MKRLFLAVATCSMLSLLVAGIAFASSPVGSTGNTSLDSCVTQATDTFWPTTSGSTTTVGLCIFDSVYGWSYLTTEPATDLGASSTANGSDSISALTAFLNSAGGSAGQVLGDTNWWVSGNPPTVQNSDFSIVSEHATDSAGGSFVVIATSPGRVVDDAVGGISSSVDSGSQWASAVWESSGPLFPGIPGSSYAQELLSEIASVLLLILPYAGAVTAFAIGVVLIRRWIGRRKATQV